MWIKRAFILLVLAALAFLLASQAFAVPSLLQYGFQPRLQAAGDVNGGQENGAEQEKQAPNPLVPFLKSWDLLREEQADSLRSAALTAHLGNVSLSTENGSSAAAELTAAYGELHALEPGVLLFGRRLFPEELDTGTASAVLDEGLAIALFRRGDPLGERFTLLGQEFRVVGVLRHRRDLGDRAEYGLMVPIKAFESQPAWEMMLAQMNAKGGAGTRAGLGKALTVWQPSGQVIDLVKEKYRAVLPLRVLLCVLVFALSLVAIGASTMASKRLLVKCRADLQREYAHQLLPRFALSAILALLMYAASLALMAFALVELAAPVYVFPEWVPAILVEPREIARTFWNNRAQASALVSMRSREALQLRVLQSYLTVIAVLAALALVKPLSALRARMKGKDTETPD